MSPQEIVQGRIDLLKTTREKQEKIEGAATATVLYTLEFAISELQAALDEIESHTFHLS